MTGDEILDIRRIENYEDKRFNKNILYKRGAYLIDERPYEVEIVSENKAVVRGEKREYYPLIVEEFLYHAPHIYKFTDDDGNIVKEVKKPEIISLSVDDIKVSQFYINEEKLNAVRTFVRNEEDIIIQAAFFEGEYIALDGHTRLYLAHLRKYDKVRAVLVNDADFDFFFYKEALRRGISGVKDMKLLNNRDYKSLWDDYCDKYFESLKKN